MELWEIVIDLLLGALETSTLIGDIFCWIKGKDNRIERRAAKQNKIELPKRDKWNTWAILFALLLIPLTAYIIARWSSR